MPSVIEVAIVGAGPYGLSVAAHLRDAGVPFRIFGKPMSTWRGHMPKGMKLKSDGFASNLSAPDADSTLEAWSAANGRPYSAQKEPVELEDFVAYSRWFAQTYVPGLEPFDVINIVHEGGIYTLTLETGAVVHARRLVMAVGITWFKRLPDELGGLAPQHVSHAFDHHDLTRFKGKDIVVLGAGASAIDTAIALDDAGARVKVAARRQVIDFHIAPGDSDDTLLRQLQKPDSGIGAGWRSFFCANTPLLFHRLPEQLRLRAVKRHLGPAPGWSTRERFKDRIEARLGRHLREARTDGGRVTLTFETTDGVAETLAADHVIAATGYRADLARLPFLHDSLRSRIAEVEGTPILSDQFEASVPGLYFVGLLAANSFGPLLRFMFGAEFAAPRLAAHLKRKCSAVTMKAAA
jgi:thioredoxin reductase